jgi:ankyrin repeat protein
MCSTALPSLDQQLQTALETANESQITTLVKALEEQNVAVLQPLIHKKASTHLIEKLLDAGAQVDHRGNHSATALHDAIFFDQEKTVALLLKRGANPNAVIQDFLKWTALQCAILQFKRGNTSSPSIILMLLDAGAHVNAEAKNGNAALHFALDARIPYESLQNHGNANEHVPHGGDHGHQKDFRLSDLRLAEVKRVTILVDHLLKNHAEINAAGKFGKTPLHFASENGYYEAAQSLIDAAADINASDDFQTTPLHFAAAGGHAHIVALLIQLKAAIDPRSETNDTPLMAAAGAGYRHIADLLIQAGASLEAKDNEGLSPLHHAVKAGHYAVTDFLVKRGADVKTKTNDGSSALHWAALQTNPEIIKLLVKHGNDVNGQDNRGNTPLHIAVTEGQEDLIKTLLDLNATSTLMNNERLTPLDIVRSKHNNYFIDLFKNKNDIIQVTTNKTSALISAFDTLLLGAGIALGGLAYVLYCRHSMRTHVE